uniref:Uncharacterized protein n=1 Tax=Euplotes harpa TaxID=151035 RepID=A0A7S3NEX2_9SPIT|mmetsp:Transcript_4967/g.5855  ORF Transcript_4967/g.5855 Transcript_4967/m.5855 type:complete len:214 (+) Transcript_4967:130-771(+)
MFCSSIAMTWFLFYATTNITNLYKVIQNTNLLVKNEKIKQVALIRHGSREDMDISKCNYKVVPAEGVSKEAVEEIFNDYHKKQHAIIDQSSMTAVKRVICSFALLALLMDYLNTYENDLKPRDKKLFNLLIVMKAVGLLVIAKLVFSFEIASKIPLDGEIFLCDFIPDSEKSRGGIITPLEIRQEERNRAVKLKMQALQTQLKETTENQSDSQ